jgi:hypothetical protein
MKRISVHLAVALFLVAFQAFFPPRARATQIQYRTVPELGSLSELVVRGKVVGVRSYWNDTRTKIFTETTIAADEAYKGRTGAVVRLTQLGGTVDNMRVTVAGAVQWKPDEEVLLFLEPYTPGTYQVTGFSQGKFTIERDRATGEAFVLQAPLGDAEMIGAPSAQSTAPRDPRGRVSLDDLLNQALGRR